MFRILASNSWQLTIERSENSKKFRYLDDETELFAVKGEYSLYTHTHKHTLIHTTTC